MNTIGDIWQSYSDNVLPADAGDVQIRECKLAFYAGAASMMEIMTAIGDSEGLSVDIGAGILQGLADELYDFADRLNVGAR